MNRKSARPLVLIVEDQLEVMRLLVHLLNQVGYDTTTATNGDEALALAVAHRPDLALLDLTLPGRDGISLLRDLHALDPQLPSIVITGEGSPDRAQAAMRNGAFDFFTKPFDTLELLACLTDALAHRRASRDSLEVSRA